MTRTLVTTAVLFLLSALGCGCSQTHDGGIAGPLTLPDVTQIEDVGRFDGFPVTLLPPRHCRVHSPIELGVKITNVTDHAKGYGKHEHYQQDDYFEVWLIHDGKEVPLTEHGKIIESRRTVSVLGFSPDRTGYLKPGESTTWHFDLANLFEIEKPGLYTVIVEDWTVILGTNDNPSRPFNAVKTSLMVEP